MHQWKLPIEFEQAFSIQCLQLSQKSHLSKCDTISEIKIICISAEVTDKL